MESVPTGTAVLDWTVPREWNIRDAWIANARGERVVDFRKSNLHVVNYSVPVRARMSLAELRPKLHSLPDRPDWIPYRTSYYAEDWGFCLSHRDLERLTDESYEVVIDSSLEPGRLDYGELVLPGSSSEEILFSAHACHPSLANDNLSGLALLAALARLLARRRAPLHVPLPLRARNDRRDRLARAQRGRDRAIRAGLTVACVGDAGPLTYKKSRRGDAEIDRAAQHVLRRRESRTASSTSPPTGTTSGSTTRPGSISPSAASRARRTAGTREYHTSADDVAFVRPASLASSLRAYLAIVGVLEGNGRYRNTQPRGEPQLGRRGLYRAIGGQPDPGELQMAMLWVLNQSDGGPTLLEIADRAGLPFDRIREAADALLAHELLVPA